MTRQRRVRSTRKPFVYFKGGNWYVQVGKSNYCFLTFTWAVHFAVQHYLLSSERNWQSPMQSRQRPLYYPHWNPIVKDKLRRLSEERGRGTLSPSHLSQIGKS